MTDPRQAAIARVDSCLCDWCSRPVDQCPCRPRPLLIPAPSAQVRVLQKARRAEHPPVSGLFPGWGAA